LPIEKKARIINSGARERLVVFEIRIETDPVFLAVFRMKMLNNVEEDIGDSHIHVCGIVDTLSWSREDVAIICIPKRSIDNRIRNW